MTMTYKRAPVVRLPAYSISELGRILGVTKDALRKRIENSTEKPTPVDVERDFKCAHVKIAERYHKATFVQWHARNWPHLHKMPGVS